MVPGFRGGRPPKQDMNPRPLARLIGAAGAFLLAAPLFAQGGPLLPPPTPAANPVTPQKTVLGKMLYWEEQMSSDDTIACGTCHRPETGFSDPRPGTHPGSDGILGTPDDRFASPGLISATIAGDYVEDPTFGLDPQITDRHSPEIVASLYAPEAFWDGRAGDAFTDPDTGIVTIPTGGALENQVLGPPLSSVEMAHMGRDWDDVTAKLERVEPMALASDLTPDIVTALAADGSYPELFEAAFGTPEITAARIAFAIATYERTLVPDDTPWDRYVAGDLNAMTPQQVVGWNQFNGIARCNLCHVPPVFSDNAFHNLGLRPSFEDEGRQGVTGLFADRGKFKTPSLRNAGLRTRFFHDGQKGVLDNGPAPGGVDDIYVDGGGPFRDNLDPLLQPLGGQPGVDIPAIFEFVENGLTDPRAAAGLPPFDRPTLWREANAITAVRFGLGNPGGNGLVPGAIARTPAVVGSQDFKVGVTGAAGGATLAYLAVSQERGFGQAVNGVPVHVGTPVALLVPFSLQAAADGSSYGTAHLSIPDRPVLEGTELVLQVFVPDTLASGGFAAATPGLSYQIP
jgi:cytochrome c peroxidase